MALPLPRSRLALGTLAAGVAAAVLLAAATVIMAGRTPVGAAASIGGPFALADQDGRTVTQETVAGRPFLVFFGYTHCPDICPTTLSDMTAMLKELGPQTTLPALFVTVDPERDTPAVLKDYLSSFDPRIRGLTGSPAAVEAAEKAYRVYARKVPAGTGGDYSMDHTAVVYLMDDHGRFLTALNLDQPPAAAAAAVKAAL